MNLVVFAGSSPVISSGHALLIKGPIQFFGVREDCLVVDDDGLDDLVDVRLAGDLVLGVGRGHQRGAEAYGQVVRVHHVLVTVLGQTGDGEGEGRSGADERETIDMHREPRKSETRKGHNSGDSISDNAHHLGVLLLRGSTSYETE